MLFDQTGADAFVKRVEQLMSGPEGLVRWYLSAIDELAREGQVGICSIHGLGWCEVDDLGDLEHASAMVGRWRRNTAAMEARDQHPASRQGVRLPPD